jgi:ribosomal protein S6--L-glutamate ligase
MKIAILSKGTLNYTTKRLREVAEARGHDVQVINYAKCYMTMERGKPVIYYKGEALPHFDAIIPRIAQSYTKYGTAVVRQFEMQGSFTTASSIAINRSRDKLRSYQILARRTWHSQDRLRPRNCQPRRSRRAGRRRAGDHQSCPRHAWQRCGAGRNPQSRQSRDAGLLRRRRELYGQEFVAESAGTDIRALVVGGRVVASIERQSLDDDFRSNTHQGGTGKAVKLTPEEEKTAIKAAKAMGLPVCGVDMMRSNDGPKVLEVNSSASIKTPELVTKRDVATKIIEYIERNAKSKPKKDKVGA